MKKNKNSTVFTFTVPSELKMLLEAAQKIGYYDSLSEFLRDSVRFTLENKKNLRIAIAYELYSKKKISLGKAAEIIKTSINETKEIFEDR
jgi:Arc/MetJ-type ribon-helix-helix transcriptional regulator